MADDFTPYKPKFEMPVIAPPQSTDPVDYKPLYDAMNLEITLTIDTATMGVEVKTKPKTSAAVLESNMRDLFAMCGGLARYLPAGSELPTPELAITPAPTTGPTTTPQISPAGGALVLEVWAADSVSQFQNFPPGIPPVARILYLGVDETSISDMLEPHVDKMKEPELLASWKAAGNAVPTSIDLATLKGSHLTRVLAGEAKVFVDGGSQIGKAAWVDANDHSLGTIFSLQFVNGETPPAFMSPLPAIRGAPYYDT